MNIFINKSIYVFNFKLNPLTLLSSFKSGTKPKNGKG